MAYKEIVTMVCDPPWDPWALDENAQLDIKSNVGPYGTNCLGLISDPESVYVKSSAGIPADINEEITLRISAIRDATLDENGNPKENIPSEVVIESGSATGVRKGDRIGCSFTSPNYRDRNEGEEVDPENLTDDGKVITSYSTIRMEFSVESMTFNSVGPFPQEDLKGVNNMFWENHAMDCKASGDGESLKKVGKQRTRCKLASQFSQEPNGFILWLGTIVYW